jgi:hypothetical protein
MKIYICLSKLSNEILTSSDFFSSFNNMNNEDKAAGHRNHNYSYAADGSRYHGKIRRKKQLAPKDITLSKSSRLRSAFLHSFLVIFFYNLPEKIEVLLSFLFDTVF